MSLLFWTTHYAGLHGVSNELLEVDSEFGRFLIPIRLDKETAYSPGIGTFGGLIPKSDKDYDQVDYKIVYEILLSQLKCKNLIVVSPPDYFHPYIFAPQRLVFRQESVLYIDINHHIELEGWTEKCMAKNERKKLNQARNAGLYFAKHVNKMDLAACIELLKDSRIRFGAKLSMTSTDIIKAIDSLPEHYRMVAVYSGNELAAAALLVRLSDSVEYVLYWGDSLKYRHLSPTVFLCEGIIGVLVSEKVQILDLGISSLRGVENPGLTRFKRNLGAIRTEKLASQLTSGL